MKTRWMILAGMATALSMTAQAALVAYEGFDYSGTSPGSEIAGLNGGYGWTGAWSAHGDGSARLSNTAMTYTGLPNNGTAAGTVDSADGSPVGTRPFGLGMQRDFTSTNIDSGTIYFSGLVQSYFFANQQAVFRFSGTGVDAGSAHFSLWFDSGNVGISDGWSAPDGGAAGATLGTYGGDVAFGTNQTAELFVLKYDFATTVATLYLNPDVSLSEGSATAATTLDFTTGLAGLGRFGLYQNSDYGTVDELRVTTTWDSITAIPEPSSLLLVSLMGVSLLIFRRRKKG